MRLRGWRVDQILTSELFDLPTARPAEFDEALKRRTELLGKSRLTKADREELKQLEARLDQLPPGVGATWTLASGWPWRRTRTNC